MVPFYDRYQKSIKVWYSKAQSLLLSLFDSGFKAHCFGCMLWVPPHNVAVYIRVIRNEGYICL